MSNGAEGGWGEMAGSVYASERRETREVEVITTVLVDLKIVGRVVGICNGAQSREPPDARGCENTATAGHRSSVLQRIGGVTVNAEGWIHSRTKSVLEDLTAVAGAQKSGS